MKILRFDHMHVSPEDYDAFVGNLQKLIGHDVIMNMPMPEYGMQVAYEPFPIGLEAFKPVVESNPRSSFRNATTAKGIFSIAFKVENLAEATAEMEANGWKKLEEYPNGPIQEALFDTKKDFGFYMELIEYPFNTLGEMFALAAQAAQAAQAEQTCENN